MAEDTTGSWPEYRKYIVSSLSEVKSEMYEIHKEVSKIRTQLELVKVKIAAVSSLAAMAVSAFMQWIMGKN